MLTHYLACRAEVGLLMVSAALSHMTLQQSHFEFVMWR
jgi:hypothetical protein